MVTNSRTINEIEIPVPWGHIAAKTWGNEKDPIILCIHGIMDNAGVFNTLIPYLPHSYYYVSTDLPGHGKSTHFPAHVPIHTLNFLLVYKELSRYFKHKLIIMGHSYGGQIGFLFAQMYPECVQKLIMLDTLTMFPVPAHTCINYLKERLDTYERVTKNNSPPLLTYEVALEKLRQGREYTDIKKKSSETLLERAVEPVNGLFKFSLDPKMKGFINPLKDFRYTIESIEANPVRCPVLIILGNLYELQYQIMQPMIEFYKKWKNIELVEVSGHHYVHSDYPERVAPYITKFLSTTKAKL